MYRWDVLVHAYRRCRANGGAAGVDGETFEQIAQGGERAWREALTRTLAEKTCEPASVRRVWIPKENDKQRPLGIPTILDRVVQTAAVLVLELIFEVDLQPEQEEHREGHRAQDAVRQLHGLIRARGNDEVVDADLSGYFDTIPHAELMQSVARRVVDRSLLALIKRWLVVAVEEDDDRGTRRRTTRAWTRSGASRKGRRFRRCYRTCTCADSRWVGRRLGHRGRLDGQHRNRADDFVTGCQCSAAYAM